MPYVHLTPEIRQELSTFGSYLSKMEYTEGTIVSYKTYVSKYLRTDAENLGGSDVLCRVERFLGTEAGTHPKTVKDRRAALYAYYKMKTGAPFPHPKADYSAAVESALAGYETYMREIKYLRNGTVDSEMAHVRRFLQTACPDNAAYLDVSKIDADVIRKYFVNTLSNLKPGSKGRLATSIRNYFKFLRFNGIEVSETVFRLPLSPAVWKQAGMPTVLSEHQIQALMNTFDRNIAVGVRDYAIASCFVVLGLRCREVAALELDDFHWREKFVNVKNTKSHTDRKLPIPANLGEAITVYLRKFRPESSSRTLFVRFSHNRGEPMGCGQVRGVMRRAGVKAGFDAEFIGTHILRRTVGSQIYRSGKSLKMVADILGHESLDSTALYTKTDLGELSQVACAWPGGIVE